MMAVNVSITSRLGNKVQPEESLENNASQIKRSYTTHNDLPISKAELRFNIPLGMKVGHFGHVLPSPIT